MPSSATLLTGIPPIRNRLAEQTIPDSKAVIRSSAREVLLEVGVRDAHGKLVTKIYREDFRLYEDGAAPGNPFVPAVHGREVRLEDEKQATEVPAVKEAVPGVSARPPFNPL